MSFRIDEIIPASKITDAVLLPSFNMLDDFIAIARGNMLYLHQVTEGYAGEPQTVELFGEILKLIPIRNSSSANLLVILKDMRSCLIRNNFDTIETVSTGNIAPSSVIDLPKTVKHAVIPLALVLQLQSHHLTVFPISPNTEFGTPFPIAIGCKRIVDFVFIGPISKVTRLAVLTEEFHSSPTLRMIEFDPSNGSFFEDPAQNIKLPDDTYAILSLLPDTHSIIVAFSSSRAIRVTYSVGLIPQTTTATIFTPSKLTWFAQMCDTFYALIDEKGKIMVSELDETGPIKLVAVADCHKPITVITITESLLFVVYNYGPSTYYTISIIITP